jgi:hypothetical protein
MVGSRRAAQSDPPICNLVSPNNSQGPHKEAGGNCCRERRVLMTPDKPFGATSNPDHPRRRRHQKTRPVTATTLRPTALHE